MSKTTALKARELLDNLSPYDRDVWVKLDNFDPPLGKPELTYAAKMGWIDRCPGKARLTESGRLSITKKPLRRAS
jgi:hypothetical protein